MAGSFDNRNYYDMLNVDRDATHEVIRLSYRRLMQQAGHHPDLGGDTKIAAMINKAYSILSDPELRRDYDARIDILDRVAGGFVQPTDEPQVDETPCRILDPRSECVFCEAPHDHNGAFDADARCGNCGSPLSTAENLRLNSGDQRAMNRVPKRLSVRFFTHWRQAKGFTGLSEDVSLRGLRLVTNRDVREGQRIRLVSKLVDAVGTVTHCVPRQGFWRTENVAGISFVTLRFMRSVGGFVSHRV